MEKIKMQLTRPQDVLITEAFADFMEKCKAKNLSGKTLGIYQVHFKFFCEYRRYKDISLLQSVLACLRPVIVALIFGAGLSILSMVAFGGDAKTLAHLDWVGIGSFAAAFFALRKLKWNPILTMCLCGVAGLGLHGLLGI